MGMALLLVGVPVRVHHFFFRLLLLLLPQLLLQGEGGGGLLLLLPLPAAGASGRGCRGGRRQYRGAPSSCSALAPAGGCSSSSGLAVVGLLEGETQGLQGLGRALVAWGGGGLMPV